MKDFIEKHAMLIIFIILCVICFILAGNALDRPY